MDTERPVALVTGASRGLGAALARQLAEDRWRLVVDARDGDALMAELDTYASPRTPEVSVIGVVGDVTDGGHRRAMVSIALEHFGRIDAVVNNASHLGPSPPRRSSTRPGGRAVGSSPSAPRSCGPSRRWPTSHLLLLEAVAGRRLLEEAYAEAVAAEYRWHEFGDSHLLLP